MATCKFCSERITRGVYGWLHAAPERYSTGRYCYAYVVPMKATPR
jgi:hypothetical protein